MPSFSFSVPGRVPGWNDLARMKGANKRTYNGVKRRWDRLVAVSAGAAEGVRLAVPGLATVSVHVVEPDMRRDHDNVGFAAQKFARDGLVLAGVLLNDGWKHVAPTLPTTLECIRGEARIEVTVSWGEQ